jgi:predicted ribosomally synthesized peptide with SipW-like signal peptide
MSKKKQSRKEKRVLAAALLVAGVITAGSTFAWFTSKDEVTNRLSASAKYDVSIAEDFQPPEDWIPGQTINKDVSAVNTGNVDAFVRMWLGGQMRLLSETTATDQKDATTSITFTEVTDQKLKDLGLTYGAGNGVYYRELSQEKIDNAQDSAHATATNEETNNPATFSEVQSMMAGGVLVYAPASAKYHWTLEQATELPVFTAGDSTATPPTDDDVTMTNLAKGTVVGNSTTGESGATKLAPASATDSNYYGAIDASTFTPETTGLYLFRRNVAETADGTANKYEYSGYYYDVTLNKYFALHTDTGANSHSDYVLPAGVIDDKSTATPSLDQVLPVTIATGQKVYLYTASEQVIETGTAAANLQWTYHAPDATKTTDLEKNGYFTVKYVGADRTSGTIAGDTADDIVIDVALANIGTTSETWTAIGSGAATTFYYNNDVEAGDTTTKLVDSVKLADDTEKNAYLAFDFDLNVYLESKQVTVDETGKEKTIPVNAWAATADNAATPNVANTGAKPSEGDDAKTYTGAEIDVVGWDALT